MGSGTDRLTGPFETAEAPETGKACRQEDTLDREPFVAVALLTEGNLRAIGKNLERVYPIDDTPAFADLLAALDEADSRRKAERGNKR